MGIKSAKVEEIKTKLIKDMHVDIEEHPTKIRNWFSRNIIDRVLAYMVGIGDDDKFHILHTDSNGNIKVISALEDYTDYYTKTLDIGVGSIAEVTFPSVAREIMVQSSTDKWVMYIKKSNNQYGSGINMVYSGVYSINISCKGIKIENNGSETSRFVILAKW